MPDYSKSKIYRLYCGEDEYIGSTTRPLSERMNEHRMEYKKNYKRSCSKTLFEKHGLENCKIELIEDFPCERKEQLNKREGEIQRERTCINKNLAGGLATVEKGKETARQYYRRNAERIKERILNNYHSKKESNEYV